MASSAARKPKVFIVGISGFLGYHLALRLRQDFLIAGVYFGNKVFIPDAQCFPVSFKSMEMLETIIRVQNPDFVINAMGINDRKFVEESAKVADNFNVVIPVSLALLAAKMKAQFIQLGCAEVFDGKEGNYTEEDTDFTLDDAYGKQKATVVSYIRTQTLESNVFRFGRAVGIGHPYRMSEFDHLRAKVAFGEPITASKKKIHTYISTRSLGDAVHTVLTSPFPHKHRLFHIGGPTLSEFQMVEAWAKLMGKPTSGIKPPQEDSPRNLSINCAAFAAAFPQWKQETQNEMFLSVLRDLNPGTEAKKWQKVLMPPPPPPVEAKRK